jgi:TolA-binding protein
MMGSGAAELYEAGMASFTRGGHAADEDAFLTIVEMHAEDPLVPDAKYYLALIQVEYDEREAAITSFREVADSYPTSPRAPEALFHVGRLYLELENRTEAANYFTRVVERYQSSPAAVLARTELDRLR